VNHAKLTILKAYLKLYSTSMESLIVVIITAKGRSV